MRTTLQKTGKHLRTEGGFEVKLDSVDFRRRQNRSQNRNHLGFFVRIFDARVVNEWNHNPANSQTPAAGQQPLHLLYQVLSLRLRSSQEWLIHEVIGA